MSKLKIATTIHIAFASIFVYILVLASGNYHIIQTEFETSEKLYNNYGKIQGDVSMGFAYFQEVKSDLRNVLYLYANNLEKQSSAIEDINIARDNIEIFCKKAEAAFIDDELLSKYKEAHDNIEIYLSDVDQCLMYVSQNNLPDARRHLYNNGIDSANRAEALIDELINDLDKKANTILNEVRKMHEASIIIMLVILIFILLSIIFAARIMSNTICVPMLKIEKIAKKISLGDVGHKIKKVDSNNKNEIAVLHNSFCDMVDNLKLQADALEKLSNGEFNIDYVPASSDDVVGNAIEKLIKDNNTAFGVIRNAAKQITVGSEQIAAASQTLAQGSTEQASAIQQISASVTDIANKTKDNASQATEVHSIVQETKEDIMHSNIRMNEMVAAMEEINEASGNIQKVIKVIDDIAFNTNILALNASVEAARAGEHGKGFAVVAEEVRNLAGRSAKASNQTSVMIEDSIEKIRKGSELAQETAKSLLIVSEMIDKVTGLSVTIAESSNNQATATAQIDQALSQVSQVVQTNSATSQQCASASEQLSGQVRGLEMQISRYKLKDVIDEPSSYKLEYEEPVMLGNFDAKY